MKLYCLPLLLIFCSLKLLAQQTLPRTYLIVQGGVSRLNYAFDKNYRLTISGSYGVKIKNVIGAGINVQARKFKEYGSPLIPVCAEISFLSEKNRLMPYVNFQFGKGFFRDKVDLNFESGMGKIQLDGGMFYSPNIGALIPVKNKHKILITAGYMNWQTTQTLVQPTPSGTFTTKRKSHTDGAKIMVGLKI